MPTHVDRDRAVGLLRREFDAITELISSLDQGQWPMPTCLPGWTVHDVLGHMVGTELMLSGVRAPTVDVAHLDHVKNPIAEANEVWVESMRGRSGPDLVHRWREISSGRLAALEAMSQDEFDAPSWTPVGSDETYGRFMRIRHFDCFMHEHDIRFALGLPARTDGDHQAWCLEEVATGLGYIVGRRAGMPDGARVAIRLTGEPACTYFIQVDGRASVVDELDGPATVGIELPVARFLRLTGGRDDGASGPGGSVLLTGDRDLAARLAQRLAFTI